MASIIQGHARRWLTVFLFVAMIGFTGWYGWQCGLNASVADVASQDLPHAWQTVWNVAHGHGFRYTDLLRQLDLPRLSAHADYILLGLAPLARVWSDYMILVWVQAAVVASGALAVWRISRRWVNADGWSFGLSLAYLLNGPLQFAVTFQFHAITLAVGFILWMAEAVVYRRRWWVIGLWLLLALCTKEQVGLIVGPLIWWLAATEGKKSLGYLFGAVAVLWSTVHFVWIIPAMRTTGGPHLFWEFYYGSLGDTPRAILPRLMQPMELWSRLVSWSQVGRGVALLVPFAGLSLGSPLILLAAAAWVPHALGDSEAVRSLYYQNQALAIPILTLAAIDTVRRLSRWARWPRFQLPALLGGLVLLTIGSGIFSPNPWSAVYRPVFRAGDDRVEIFQTMDRLIPASAVVAVSWGLPPTFRDHPTVYVLPAGVAQAEYVVVGVSALETLRTYAPAYASDLRDYFDHSVAFMPVIRYADVVLYRRVPGVTPEPLPAGFHDPTLNRYWSHP